MDTIATSIVLAGVGLATWRVSYVVAGWLAAAAARAERRGVCGRAPWLDPVLLPIERAAHRVLFYSHQPEAEAGEATHAQ